MNSADSRMVVRIETTQFNASDLALGKERCALTLRTPRITT